MDNISLQEHMSSDSEPNGLQHLRECSGVAVSQEAHCCSSKYFVTSVQETFLSSEGAYNLVDSQGDLTISLQYKKPWFQRHYMLVEVVNCRPVSLSIRGGFSSSLLVKDEFNQPWLKIRRPWLMSTAYKVLWCHNDKEVASLRPDGGDWDVYFPKDLELRFKAALIAACFYFNIESWRTRSRLDIPLCPAKVPGV